MALLKFVLYAVVVIGVITLALMFGLRNKEAILVDFFFVQNATMGSGFWILSSLISGILIGWLLSVPNSIFLKFSNKKIQRKVKNQSDELTRLKGSFLKGN